MSEYRSIFYQGLWKNNVGVVQLLGLCPLLAVSNTTINALGLGLATTFTLVITNLTISLVRGGLRNEIRIPAFVLVIASAVTAVELIMHAYFFELFQVLGIFIPLIVTNCAIIGRAEAFASKQSLLPSLADGVATGVGFLMVLVVLGAMREVIGFGTLFAGSEMLFGSSLDLTLTVIPDYHGFLIAILPPGAFFGLAAIVAAKQAFQQSSGRGEGKASAQPVSDQAATQSGTSQ